MSTIKLAWKHDGQADSFNIYKSTLPMSLANMPEPAYTGITEKIFIDESIIDGVEYFYRVGAVRGTVVKFGDEIKVDTSINGPELAAYTPSAFANSNIQTVNIPSAVLEGDLLVAIVMHRSALTVPEGWTILDSTVSSYAAQAQTVLYRDALSGDAGSALVFTQATQARMANCLLVLRHSAGCEIINVAKIENQSQTNGIINLASIPNSSKKGIAFAAANWTFAVTGSQSTYTVSEGLQALPPVMSIGLDDQIRQGVAYKNVLPGDEIIGQIATNALDNSEPNTASAISFIVTYRTN